MNLFYKLHNYWETFPFKMQFWLCCIVIAAIFMATCLLKITEIAQLDPLEARNESSPDIALQLSHCWNIPRNKVGSTPKVDLFIAMNPDATIQSIRVASSGKKFYDASEAYRKASEAGIAALKACGPMRFLLKRKYDEWKELQLTLEAHHPPI